MSTRLTLSISAGMSSVLCRCYWRVKRLLWSLSTPVYKPPVRGERFVGQDVRSIC